MPRPTSSDVHNNRPLTNLSVSWRQDAKNFLADIFGTVKSQKQSDTYYIWALEDLYRTEAEKVGDTALSPIRGENLSTDTFSCDVWSVREILGEQKRANADEALNLDESATVNVTQDLMIRKDVDWVAEYFVTGKWTTETTGVDTGPGAGQFLRWNVTGSTPIEDLRGGIRAVTNLTGYEPNVLALGGAVWDALADHPDLLDRVKHTQKGIVTKDLLASVLSLDEVRVGNAIRNTAAPGATASLGPIGGKHAMLAYRPPNPGLNVPAAGYNFAWTGLIGGNAGQRIRRYQLVERQNATAIEGHVAFDNKLVAADLAAFFLTAVA